MGSPTLTKKQRLILDFIVRFREEHGFSPSYREIARHFGLSSIATVAAHVEALKRKRALEKEYRAARSLKLGQAFETDYFTIPLLGLIAAGRPIEAIETPETIEIPRDMTGPKTFALKVKGDSMIDEGIFDGDYVIIEQTQTAQNGDIVVALIDQENATLKRFFKEKNHVRLQAANAKYGPIRVKNVIIQGKVKGLIRKFLH